MEGVCTNASYDLVSTAACKVVEAAPSHRIKTGTTGQRGAQVNVSRVQSTVPLSPESSATLAPDARPRVDRCSARGEQQRRQTLPAVLTAYPRRHVPDDSTYAAGGAGADVAGTDHAPHSSLVQTSSLGLFGWDRPTRAGPGSGRSKRKIAPPPRGSTSGRGGDFAFRETFWDALEP